ncbi:receptor for retinol uptake stra6-like [Crassostrea virginica]
MSSQLVVFTTILVISNRVTGHRFNILYSRPGHVFPLDIFKRSHRFFLAAAYGTLAHLCTGIIVESKYTFSYHGPRYLRGLITMVSMLVYGLGYLPLILGISLESPIGYLAAIPFSWIFTAEFFTCSICRQKNTISDIVLFLSVLPEVVCFLFLSIGLPIQLGLSIHKQSKCKFTMFLDSQSSDDCYESIKNSYQGKYVRNILKRPRKTSSTSEPLHRYITEGLKHILGHVFYKKSDSMYIHKESTRKDLQSRNISKHPFIVSAFRISSRMVSINVVGFIVIYRIAFFLVTNVYSVLKFCEDVIISQFLRIGIDPQPDDNDDIVKYRACLFSSYKFLVTFKECFLVSMILCLVLNLLFLQRNFITYRNNLLSLYKGRSPIHITTREETTNPKLMVGSMMYAGYQVGHIGGVHHGDS